MRRLIHRTYYTSALNLTKETPNNLKGKSHSAQRWLTRQLSDPFVQMAKMQNYRCRSAFKLLEIDERAHIFAPGQTIIDIGAAPGSWTDIAVQKSNANGKMENKPKGFVIGLDLLNIHPIEGAIVLSNADFREPSTHEHIKQLLENRPIDCVLSDMAPNATGVRALDHENIMTLCYTVLRFAILMSAPNASLLVKIWDNGDVKKLEKDMSKFYRKVKHFKPKASRTDSTERFMLAKGFYGLKLNENL